MQLSKLCLLLLVACFVVFLDLHQHIFHSQEYVSPTSSFRTDVIDEGSSSTQEVGKEEREQTQELKEVNIDRDDNGLFADDKEWCIDAFLNRGFVPPNMYLSKAVNELKEWFSKNCHQLFCENNNISHCRWSYDAIQILLNDKLTLKCTEEQLDKFRMPEEWSLYQFSDFFNGANNRYTRDSWRSYFFFNNSLFGEYHIEAVKRGAGWGQYPLLMELIKKKKSQVQGPSANTTVVHLRIGDVMGRKNQSVADLLHHQNLYYPGEWWAGYVKPLSVYSSLEPAKNIVFMGGLHHITNKEEEIKSCQYVSVLKRYFEARGSTVSLRLGEAPDNDILYASQSKHFCTSGGGFSKVLATVVYLSGGKATTLK